MNGYVCFYRGHRHEVHADTPLKAQESALGYFQKKYPRRKIKTWEISATIAERNGEQVVHTAVN